MEQIFGINSIEIHVLRRFCVQHGEIIEYQKGEQMERESQPSRWFGFVEKGCLKFVTQGISDGKEHLTWFSFKGEFVGDYPACLYGGPSLTTIEAMTPSRVYRVSGEQLMCLFSKNSQMMELRSRIAEHLLGQARQRFLDFYRTTSRERYELLLHRCSGIANHLPLHAIASFLNITPQMLSRIRKDITFDIK